MCVHHCAQLSYTTKHRTVLIIFPPNLQTVVMAVTLYTVYQRGGGDPWNALLFVATFEIKSNRKK